MIKNRAAATLLIAVPKAAPTTFKSKPKIKIGSKIIFKPTLAYIPIIETIGAPIARANCSNMKNKITKGALKNITFK